MSDKMYAGLNGDRKGIAIGHYDFERIITDNCYFVDKTLLIRDILDSNAAVSLITRPRRFGKTLNMYMLRRFFEDEINHKGEKVDHKGLFEGLKIMSCGENYTSEMGKYPVIFLSLNQTKLP